MTIIDYKVMYEELVEALGYDVNIADSNLTTDHDNKVKVAKILRRVAVTMQTHTPESSGALYLCGIGGSKDDMGLPEYVHICPTYGLQGVAVYQKVKDYSEPGW